MNKIIIAEDVPINLLAQRIRHFKKIGFEGLEPVNHKNGFWQIAAEPNTDRLFNFIKNIGRWKLGNKNNKNEREDDQKSHKLEMGGALWRLDKNFHAVWYMNLSLE